MSEKKLSERIRYLKGLNGYSGPVMSWARPLADEVAALEQANANLEERLLSVLEVAVARGERLGYADEDYRETLTQGDNGN